VRAYPAGRILLLLLLGAAPPLAGQDAEGHPGEPGSELEIYVMTMGVGSEIWERFGHNAIGVRDRSRGTDLVYNYGTFDFAAPGFVANFLKGRMTYWLDVADAGATIRFYRERRHRSVYIQELNLLPIKRQELRDFLEWNARDENKYYRYDYYRDNCSTRVRDALDRLLGGMFRSLTDTALSGATFRSHTRRLTTNNPFMYTGIAAAMGHPVDRPISAWEEMFLPLSVREQLRHVTVPGTDGRPVPLVRSERTVYESDVHSFRESPPAWLPWFLLLGLGLGGLAWLLAARGVTRRAARTGFAALGAGWYLVMGVGGLILLGLWGWTDHVAARQNENVLQLNLLALPLVLLLPLGLARGGRWGRAALRLSAVVTALAVGGLLLKLLPGFGQVNLEIIALAVPVYLGLTAGLLTLLRSPSPTPRTPSPR
jgi:hypothetical protein